MKKFFILLAFTIMASSQAQVKYEFDEATENKCHKEIKALGCVNSTGAEVSKCLEAQKSKLSKSCKALHEERKVRQR